MPALNTGAGKVRRAKDEPKSRPIDLLKKAIEDAGSGDVDRVYEAFKEEILEIQNDAQLDEVIMFWFGPAFAGLTAPKKDVQAAAHDRSRRKAEIKAEVESVKASILSKVILLDMVLPHGKTLRDSTGRECASLGPKIGAWMERIASEVRPGQVVGQVLSEDRVRALYAA